MKSGRKEDKNAKMKDRLLIENKTWKKNDKKGIRSEIKIKNDI